MNGFEDSLTSYLEVVDRKGTSDNGETAFITIYPRILEATVKKDIKALQRMHEIMVKKEEERDGNVPPEFGNYKHGLSAVIYHIKNSQKKLII